MNKDFKICEHNFNANNCLICENDRLREELVECQKIVNRVRRFAKQHKQIAIALGLRDKK